MSGLRRRMDRRRFDLEIEGLKAQLARMVRLSDRGRDKRVERAREDYGYFSRTYFPHLFPDESSEFHAWLDDEATRWGKGDRILIAAPRGNAKTTKITRAYVLWRIIRGDCHNVLIVSDTIDQAKKSLEQIEVELEENPRLLDDFPEATGEGRIWQQEMCVTKNDILISCAGAGKRIRGLNFRGHRPDVIILDDLENDENVRTKAQRDKLEHWFTHTVLYLGPPDRSELIIYIGTYLHYDGLMARIEKRGDFRVKKFKALIRWPHRMDLWEGWKRRWKEDRGDAELFYVENRDEMERGARVLWPNIQPLYTLMEEWASNPRAFNAELQNEPLDEESRVFRVGPEGLWQEFPQNLVTFGAVDPAMGKRRGDMSAIVVVGRDPKTGKVYEVESRIGRIPPQRLIDEIIRLHEKWRCIRWGIEDVAFQEFFRQILIKEGLKRRVPIPAVGIRTQTNKELRIESLAPYIENGTLYISPDSQVLIDQLNFYPLADHDDGPDALEMAFRLAYQEAPVEFKRGAKFGGGIAFRGRGF